MLACCLRDPPSSLLCPFTANKNIDPIGVSFRLCFGVRSLHAWSGRCKCLAPWCLCYTVWMQHLFFTSYSTLCFFVGCFFGLVWVGLDFVIEPVCHAGTLMVCSHTSPEGLAVFFRVQQLPLITIQGGLSQELHSSLASDKPLLQAVFRLFFSSKGWADPWASGGIGSPREGLNKK